MFLILCSASDAEGVDLQVRARAKSVPVAIEQPQGWESFDKGDDQTGEILFLQSPVDEPEKTVHLSLHYLGSDWEGLVKRQNYHLIVDEGTPIMMNESLSLRGSRGHKWVYQAKGSDGQSLLFYRLYLVMPASVSSRRLLVLQGSAPAESAPTSVPFFNDLVRTLVWGLAADS